VKSPILSDAWVLKLNAAAKENIATKVIFFMMNKPSFSLWIILQDHDFGRNHALRHIIVLVSG
jgi:hypothetical protein